MRRIILVLVAATLIAVAAVAFSPRSHRSAAAATLPWQSATLGDGWANRGAPYSPAAFREVDTRVYLRGVICGPYTSIGRAAFTLPAGERPPAALSPGTVALNGEVANILVASAGTVTPEIMNDGCIDLSVVSFDTLP